MKKLGFTLAEVLITLSIIGVVASMTMPALMTNTQEQQAITGLKKGINTLTEIGQTNNAMEGWDFASAAETAADIQASLATSDAYSFTTLLAKRAQVDFAKGSAPKDMKTEALATYKAVYLKDGTAIYYESGDTVKATADNAKTYTDNLPIGYVVYYDTNGMKGPNIVSNCASGGQLGAVYTSDGGAADKPGNVTADAANTACATTTGNRNLKDIYAIRIRGTIAEPEGNASVYIMSRK